MSISLLSRKRLSIGEVLKHPWLTQPSPCPSFLAITAVIGVTNDNTSHLVANSNNVNNNNIHSNGKNSNKISNGIASYGLVVDSEQSPNPREDQEAVERLRGGAAVVQCETPSSSSIGSCEESDAEIIMEDQRGLQHQQPQSKQQIVNEDSSSDTINMNSDNNSRRSQSRNGVVEAKQTRGSSPVMAKRAIVNEVETPNVVAVAGHDDVVPNNPADSTIGVQLQHGETSEQLVQIHESSGEERYVGIKILRKKLKVDTVVGKNVLVTCKIQDVLFCLGSYSSYRTGQKSTNVETSITLSANNCKTKRFGDHLSITQ